MALTGANAAGSSLYKRQTALNATRDRLQPREMNAKEKLLRVEHTVVAADGDASTIGTGGEMNLAVIPAGATIDLKRFYFGCTAALGDGTNIELGWRAYKKPDGSTEAEDANGICTLTDLGNSDTLIRQYFGTGESSITPGVGAGKLGLVYLNSREPVTLFATFQNGAGTIDVDTGDVLSFQIGYFLQ